MEKNNKKKLDVLKLINSLNINQLKIYSVLKNLEEKNGYSFMSTKNLAKQVELEEKEVVSILYFLVKKRLLYFIDIKDKDNRLLEKRLYTNKFNYFKDCRKKEKLKPHHNEKESYIKEDVFKKKELTQKEKDIIKINQLVEEYWENMDSLEYAEKYEIAEKKFKNAIQVNELNSFQQMIFEKTAEIYMKEVIKQEVAKSLGKDIDLNLENTITIFPENLWRAKREKDKIEDVFLFK